jgi:hypothetical protein
MQNIIDFISPNLAISIVTSLPQILFSPCLSCGTKVAIMGPINGLKLFALFKISDALTEKITTSSFTLPPLMVASLAINYGEFLLSSKAHSIRKIGEMEITVPQYANLDYYIPNINFKSAILFTGCDIIGFAMKYYYNNDTLESDNITFEDL